VQAAAGGGSDIFARTMADILTKEKIVEQPINVVNKPGGSGAVAYSYLRTKKGDPHIIATATGGYLTTPIQGQSPVSYKDFSNLAILCVEDYVAVVRTDAPYKTLKEVIEAAKKKPNGIRFGGSSVGSSDSIIEFRMEKAAGVQLNYIVFQSGGEVNAALLGGSVDLASPNPSEAAQLIQAKRLRPLAMFSPERLKNWPEVPTAREQGIDVTLEQFRGVVAPSGLTKEQSLFWQNAIVKMFQSTEFKNYLENNGLRPLLKVGDDAEKYIAQENEFYTKVLTELGVAKKK
jgi:putative tricarboxylic transport membrane protein